MWPARSDSTSSFSSSSVSLLPSSPLALSFPLPSLLLFLWTVNAFELDLIFSLMVFSQRPAANVSNADLGAVRAICKGRQKASDAQKRYDHLKTFRVRDTHVLHICMQNTDKQVCWDGWKLYRRSSINHRNETMHTHTRSLSGRAPSCHCVSPASLSHW